MKSVSILTPTTNNRKSFLLFASKCIQKQDYKNIIEWIIIDGTKEGESDLEETIDLIKNKQNMPKIVFINQDVTRNNRIGSLRNILNKTAQGDILVNFDDDDYYPEKRISHAVSKLHTANKQLAVCSPMYMYEADLRILFKFKSFGPYHGVGCTMAYTKDYANKNKYDDEVGNAEEKMFTNHFQNEAVQLDPKHTIIHTSHKANTYTLKRDIIWQNILLPDNHAYKQCFKESNTLKGYCKDKQLLKEYLSLIHTSNKSEYDIVYFCGVNSHEWDPESTKLGGSEQAVIQLSENWVKQGYKVAVYGNINDDKNNYEHNGVIYKKHSIFTASDEYNIIILWRLYGLSSMFEYIKNIKAKQILVDLHDCRLYGEESLVYDNIDVIKNIYFKSDSHRDFFLTNITSKNNKKLIFDKSVSIQNGIRKDIFKNVNNVAREKYRFCYCSCYLRGLDRILAYMFPIIKGNIPEAELHLYYGLPEKNEKNKDYIEMMEKLIVQPGVIDHGKQPLSVIAEEKYKSNFNLYYSSTTMETDCISIKESAYAGCIPIISTLGVFKDRPGIHLKGDPHNIDDIKNACITIIQLLSDDKKIEEIREKIQTSDILKDWNDISEEWIEKFNN